jgi:hypothetical protein
MDVMAAFRHLSRAAIAEGVAAIPRTAGSIFKVPMPAANHSPTCSTPRRRCGAHCCCCEASRHPLMQLLAAARPSAAAVRRDSIAERCVVKNSPTSRHEN